MYDVQQIQQQKEQAMNTCTQCDRVALHEDTPLCRDHLVESLAPQLAEERVAALDAQLIEAGASTPAQANDDEYVPEQISDNAYAETDRSA